MKFVKIVDDATLPIRGTKFSAGYDLVARESKWIYGNSQALISTGISWEAEGDCDLNKVGLIWPRSGLAAKHGIDTMAGVIDADYTGEIKVLLRVNSPAGFQVNKGDRIAQLIIQTFGCVSNDEHTAVVRNGGFGSTGLGTLPSGT